MNAFLLGLLLILAGVALIAITWFINRLTQRQTPGAASAPSGLERTSPDEAILLVQSGGKIAYLNQTARQWFSLDQREPHLERLGRAVQPLQNFLKLCAEEGQASFRIHGSPVDGVSYTIPFNGSQAQLVALRRPQVIDAVAEQNASPSQSVAIQRAFDRFRTISQSLMSSLDLEDTMRSILENAALLVNSDYQEIALYEAETQEFSHYRLSATGLAKHNKRSALEDSLTGLVFRQRQALRISDLEQFKQEHPSIKTHFACLSYLGMPFIINDNPLGVLELASISRDAYQERDLAAIRLLSEQAAIALQHALFYQEEQRRRREMAGFAQLSQAISSLRNLEDLYAHLVETIQPLLEVRMLGFLIYDEYRRLFEGKHPFIGFQATMLSWTRFPIEAGSEGESIWLAQELIQTDQATTDPRFRALGLDRLAVTAGIQRAVLIPLVSGGRGLGYLLAGDKRDGSAFNPGELQLLSILTAQAAPIIENAALLQESNRRAQRAETLRRIGSLIGSAATLDEILKYSLQDLARLLGADCASIFLLDEDRHELRLHSQSLFGISAEQAIRLGRLPTDDPQYHQMVSQKQRPYLSDDVSADSELLPFYRHYAELLEINSLIALPLIIRERSLGEILFGSQKTGFFNSNDLLTLGTAAGQLAGAIEQSRLYSQTDESLRRRVDQLTALTRISRELNSTLDLHHLLQRVFEEALHTTSADCGTIMLLDLSEPGPAGETSPTSKLQLHLGDPHPPTLSPLELSVVENQQALIINDFEQTIDLRRSSLPVAPAHPGVRSALIVPIAYQKRIAGLIHLHSRSPYRFDESALGIAETLAIQAAIALGNALRYQEQVRHGELLKRRVEILAKILEINQSMQAELSLEQVLAQIARVIQEITAFESVLISVYDEKSSVLRRVVGVGISEADMEELRAHQVTWNSVRQIMRPEFSFGSAYFIPYERLPIIPADIHTITLLPVDSAQDADRRSEAAWHPEDLFFIPLLDPNNEPLGLISLDAPRDGLRPDRTTIEALEIFGAQTAAIIENHKKLDSLAARLDKLQQELEQAQTADEVARAQLPVLVQKELEQAHTIDLLSRRSRRIRHGMDIAEIVIRQPDRYSMLHTLASELIARLGMDLALIAEDTPHGPRLIDALGQIPKSTNLEAMLGQRNPLSHCLQSGEALFVTNLEHNPDWSQAPLLAAMGASGFICLPVNPEGGWRYAILATGCKPIPDFTQDDEHLFTLLSRLVSVSLQNLNLIHETSQRLEEVNLLLGFSRQLGSLDPDHILQMLVESAVQLLPQAEACMVALWHPKRGLLIPQAAVGYPEKSRLLEICFRPGETLPGLVFQTGEPQRLDEVDFAKHYELSSENLLRYRDATRGRLPLSSMVIPIKQAAQAAPLGVLVLDSYSSTAAFSASDQALITSLAQQTALNLENTRLYRASEQRAMQLQALNQAAARLTTYLQPDDLIASLLDQLAGILPYDTGTLWLLKGKQAVVQAARGFENDHERVGISVAIEDAQLLRQMIESGQPINIGDVRFDPRFPTLLEPERLSWLGVPLLSSRKVIGVIALEKNEQNYYSAEDVQIATTFAGQAAVALENARLFQDSLSRAFELDQRTQRLEMLNRLSTVLSESLDINRILQVTTQELFQVLHCTGISAIVFNPDESASVIVEYPSTAIAPPQTIPPGSLFERLRETLGVYYCEDVLSEQDLSPLADFFNQHHTQSLLALPLATGNDLHGALLVHTQDTYHFTAEEIGLGRTICNQAAISIQNARLFAETRSLSQDLEKRVEQRTVELAREHKRSETLLRIITELSASLDLEQVLNRTLKVLNEVVDAEQISVLILREGEKNLHHLASVGYAPIPHQQDRRTPFSPDQSLAGWVISSRQPVLIANILEDARWVQRPDAPTEHRSAIGVPLMIGEEALGALLFFHRKEAHFSPDQLDLVQAAANQVAVAVNNAELYRLIRDQAEDLGKMLREQQIEASRSQAILEAVADGVLVTDAQRRITLFNASAERILNLERSRVIGKSLEDFTGLFGGAAQSWMETIRAWSADPTRYQRGELHEEQIALEDGGVVSVHLAPVSLRNQFLGTVSIFRDVTHQVELDRLKSEFVATVSHELRTPMTSIKGYVDILLMGAAGELDEKQKRFLEIVKNNTERLTLLVNDLLDISRIETGKVSLSLQPVDLKELVQEALGRLTERSQREAKPMHIHFKPARRVPLALGDAERLSQVLDNLLENAYDYTPADGEIIVSLHKRGEEVQVDIQDTGIGIPPELQPRVFERFYRGEHPYVLATSGTGLGLSIVQHLVEMHKGRIWLESSGVPGEGSKFSFTLPVYHPEEHPLQELGAHGKHPDRRR